MELKDLVRIDFEPLENHAMLISDFSEVYEYKDNKKTEKIRGYNAELMQKYVIDFDKEASSVYTQKGKFGVQFKLVANGLLAE